MNTRHMVLPVLLGALGLPAAAQDSVTTDAGTIFADKAKRFFKEDTYSPYAGRNFPDRPLWGDQHLHTSWSADAVGGGTRLGPAEAYRFARGEEVVSSSGQKVRLARPLDWLAVSDHSDAMGVVADIIAGKPELMTDPQLKKWHQMTNAGPDEAMQAVMEMITLQGQGKIPPAMTDPNTFRDVWGRYTAIAEQYNDPGQFTAMIAYEWTSNYGGGNNLHRNILYRNGKALADQVLPLTTFDTENPEELWAWMQGYEDKTGGRVLAIPHNGNLSNGLMFAVETFEGNPLTKEWADQRRKWERLYEVTQGKGTSEQHPSLAPNDEFANFEIVKGWLDAEGKAQETIYDVVWGDADKRQRGADGKLPPVGNTVNAEQRDLEQQHRRPRADHRLDRPGLRPRSARLLLCPRAGDPDTALDHLRCRQVSGSRW